MVEMECTKVKFATESAAEFYIKKLKATSIRREKPIRAYLCPFCTTWHLTSKTIEERNVISDLKKELHERKMLIQDLQKTVKDLKNELFKARPNSPLLKQINFKNNKK